ncbi:MAG: EcsC family protein [Acidobacteria bacterium]|nr:EcsC family protein [Acidobacteriota bacterium]
MDNEEKRAEEKRWPQAEEFLEWLTEKALGGVPGLLPGDIRLSSARELAEEYLNDGSYQDPDERVEALIRFESAKSFAAGFVCGLGGILTIPIALPGALAASWIIQARMAAAIARIYGHDLDEDRVKTVVLLSLLGRPALDVLRQAGVTIGKKLSTQLVNQIPGRFLIEINKRVGFRLLTKAGEKGVVNIIKVVPVVGGGIGGALDAATCRATGEVARSLFRDEALVRGP